MASTPSPTMLVTGGAGFIGSHLLAALAADSRRVTVIDDLSTGVRENVPAACDLVVADLRTADLSAILQERRPDIVVHLAAQANVRRSVVDPVADAETNVLATLRLLEACRKTGLSRFVFASSGGAIYGEQERVPTPEDASPRPASPYGAAKLAVEKYLAVYSATAGLRSSVLRFGNVYGPRQLPEGEAGVVAIFAERLLRREPIDVFGDGLQTRDYVFVEDVVDLTTRAIGAALQDRPMGPLNVGTGIETSVRAIADAVESALGRRADRRYLPAIKGELSRNALDSSRARECLGWVPRTGLREGIARTMEWYRSRAASAGESLDSKPGGE